MPITAIFRNEVGKMRREEAFYLKGASDQPTDWVVSMRLERAVQQTCLHIWLTLLHAHHPYMRSTFSTIHFHAIRNSVGVTDCMRSILKMYIFGFVLGIEFNSFFLFVFLFPVCFFFYPHCFHYRWTNFCSKQLKSNKSFAYQLENLCFQYCANVERYAQKLMCRRVKQWKKSIYSRVQTVVFGFISWFFFFRKKFCEPFGLLWPLHQWVI